MPVEMDFSNKLRISIQEKHTTPQGHQHFAGNRRGDVSGFLGFFFGGGLGLSSKALY